MEFMEQLGQLSGPGASALNIRQAARNFAGIRLAEGVRRNEEHERLVAEVTQFVTDCSNGAARPRHYETFGLNIQEALTSSDFTHLFADVLDRDLLARYVGVGTSWQAFARRRVVTDFREAKSFFLDGPTGLLSQRGERGEFEEAAVTDGNYSIRVGIFGKSVSLPFETLTNDDLGAFNQIPVDLAQAAVNTEEQIATELLCDVNGPNATFFNEGNDNIVDLELNYENLKDVLTQFLIRKDANGMPIRVNAMSLVVGPSMLISASELLNAVTVELGALSDTRRLVTENPLRNIVKIVRNDFIDIVASNASKSPWFVVADPAVGRPAMQVGFLRGFEQPGLYSKASDRRTATGAPVDARLGDFETMSSKWQVVHIVGSGYGDHRMAIASKGGTTGGGSGSGE